MQERLKGLDGLRGVLAIIIALSHSSGHFIGWYSSLDPITNATIVVDVFFAISGIVLYHVYSRPINTGSISVKEFLWRRVFRLFPLHVVTMVLVPVCLFISTGHFYPDWIGNVNIPNLLGDFFLLSYLSIGFTLVTNQPSWSISIELYIGSLILLSAVKYRFMAPVFALVAVGIAFIFKPTPIHQAPFINYDIVRCLYSMSWGIMSYQFVSCLKRSLDEGSIIFKSIAILGLVFLSVLIFSKKLYGVKYFVVIPFLSIFLSVLSLNAIRTTSFLDNKFFQWLGCRSYSVYLLHTPVIYLLISLRSQIVTTNIILVFASVIITLSISGFFYKKIEMPFIRWANNFYLLRKNLNSTQI